MHLIVKPIKKNSQLWCEYVVVWWTCQDTLCFFVIFWHCITSRYLHYSGRTQNSDTSLHTRQRYIAAHNSDNSLIQNSDTSLHTKQRSLAAHKSDTSLIQNSDTSLHTKQRYASLSANWFAAYKTAIISLHVVHQCFFIKYVSFDAMDTDKGLMMRANKRQKTLSQFLLSIQFEWKYR